MIGQHIQCSFSLIQLGPVKLHYHDLLLWFMSVVMYYMSPEIFCVKNKEINRTFSLYQILILLYMYLYLFDF